MKEIEFDGLIISVLVSTKEQYEETRAAGTIGSMAIEEKNVPTCNYDPASEDYNVPEVEEAITKCTGELANKILIHMIKTKTI